MVMVAVPTNFAEAIGAFDASVVEGVLAQVAAECPNAVTVIRSTMQPGVTSALAAAKRLSRVLDCPEFLREGRSLDDCLHPDRLVIGADDPSIAEEYRTTVEDVYASNGVPMPPVVLCSTQEAEAAKLAANTYLALRVAFFNELDSFACHRGLDAGKVIQAVCLDTRVGGHYNNPSFGYGGYCLPKDTKAFLGSFGEDAPSELIEAVVNANASRKRDITEAVLALGVERIGIYRLVAKANSDSLRSSAMTDIVVELVRHGADVTLYEPIVETDSYLGAKVVGSVEELFGQCDIVLANRVTPEIAPYRAKVFSRDLYGRD